MLAVLFQEKHSFLADVCGSLNVGIKAYSQSGQKSSSRSLTSYNTHSDSSSYITVCCAFI